jgi:hypothetical protein
LDVVQHFPSLDHARLREKISQVIEDKDVLWLVDQILSSGADALSDEYTPVYFSGDDLYAVSRSRGLPIGNLTSQFWSNVYLSDLDHFVARELGCVAYLRYVDDFALFGDNKSQLHNWKQRVIDRLAKDRLIVHERQGQVLPTRCGIPWLGFVVYPTHRLLKRRNAIGFARKLRSMMKFYEQGRIVFDKLDASIQGWINHVRYADTWGLRKRIFETYLIPK